MYSNPYANLYQPLAAIQQPQQRLTIPKVNGLNGANAFNLPPDSDVLALDANEAIIWLIQTDSAGYKTCTPWDFSPHKMPQPVTDSDMKTLEDRFSQLEERVMAIESNSRHAADRTSQGGKRSAGNDSKLPES